MAHPSKLVKCFIGPHGEQQTRVHNRGHHGVVLVSCGREHPHVTPCRISQQQFRCVRLDGGKRCQCCDCGTGNLFHFARSLTVRFATEEKTVVFEAADIARNGICDVCEKPAKSTSNSRCQTVQFRVPNCSSSYC